MGAGGLAYGASAVLSMMRISRAVSSSSLDADLGAAVTEPLIDHMTTLIGLTLLGGLLALVVLLVWAVTQAGR
jgi:hypothetical protein